MPGQPILHERLQLVLGDRRSAVLDDVGDQPLAHLLVLDPDDRGLAHPVVLAEQFLHLGGEDVLPARDDHLVVAALDEEPALGVEPAEVATGDEIAEPVLVLAAGVTGEQQGIADEDAPDFTLGHLFAVLIHELDGRAQQQAAGGARRLAQILG